MEHNQTNIITLNGSLNYANAIRDFTGGSYSTDESGSWCITFSNTCEFMIDNRSYTHNLSSVVNLSSGIVGRDFTLIQCNS